jgi:hypothetical protein
LFVLKTLIGRSVAAHDVEGYGKEGDKEEDYEEGDCRRFVSIGGVKIGCIHTSVAFSELTKMTIARKILLLRHLYNRDYE